MYDHFTDVISISSMRVDTLVFVCVCVCGGGGGGEEFTSRHFAVLLWCLCGGQFQKVWNSHLLLSCALFFRSTTQCWSVTRYSKARYHSSFSNELDVHITQYLQILCHPSTYSWRFLLNNNDMCQCKLHSCALIWAPYYEEYQSIDLFTNFMHTILTKVVPDNLQACPR